MLKEIKKYQNLYGHIPTDSLERMDYLLKDIPSLNKTKRILSEEIHRLINVKWNKYSCTIYLLPKATPRPRKGMNGVFYVKGAKDNKKIFEDFINNQDTKIITTPSRFYCDAYFPIPKSMSKYEKILAELGLIRPTSKPDWDNIAKTYSDMIQGLLLYDDSLIIEGVSRKYYSVKPRIEITIEYMNDYDSEFNKNKIRKEYRQ